MKELETIFISLPTNPAHVFNWAVGPEGISLKEGREIFKGRAVLGGFENVKMAFFIEAVRKKFKLKPNDW